MSDTLVRAEQAHTREPFWGHLGTFVTDYLAHAYARQVDSRTSRTWCPQWWKHREAMERLTALQQGYVYGVVQAPAYTPGVGIWFRDHADHHMPELFNPQGPFKFCSPSLGHKDLLNPLPTSIDRTGAPEWLFPAAGQEPEPFWKYVGTFVTDYLAHAYARQVTDTQLRTWCPRWWDHREAMERLTALHEGYVYEVVTAPPRTPGVGIWFRDHADHHMPELFSPDGPFKFCSARQGHKTVRTGNELFLEPLPTSADHTGAPAGLFPPGPDRLFA